MNHNEWYIIETASPECKRWTNSRVAKKTGYNPVTTLTRTEIPYRCWFAIFSGQSQMGYLIQAGHNRIWDECCRPSGCYHYSFHHRQEIKHIVSFRLTDQFAINVIINLESEFQTFRQSKLSFPRRPGHLDMTIWLWSELVASVELDSTFLRLWRLERIIIRLVIYFTSQSYAIAVILDSNIQKYRKRSSGFWMSVT
jgi:hypothetical protein